MKNTFRNFLYKIPGFKDLYRKITALFGKSPDFNGWGMITHTKNPWENGGNDDISKLFYENHQKILNKVNKKEIYLSQFADYGNNTDVLNSLMWRHYYVHFSVLYSLKAKTKNYPINLVECGVCDGLTASFALYSLKNKQEFKIYLYDAWAPMKKEYLNEAENKSIGWYSYLDINNVQRNLQEFSENCIYNQGYIPDSFANSDNPNELNWLHIDLNAASPTKAALEFFYDKIISGGVILFDDYAWHGQSETKLVIDEFFHNKSGILQPIPTGQALYYKL